MCCYCVLRRLVGAKSAPIATSVRDTTRNLGACEPAQAFVEFGLVMFALVLLFAAVVDLGRAFYEAQAMHQAVGAGALVAMEPSRVTDCSSACSPTSPPCFADTGVACANDEVMCAITAAVPWRIIGGDCRLPNSGDTITLASQASPAGPWTASDWAGGSTYTIKMTHNFKYITPILSSTKTLTLSAVMTANRNSQ
jgi:hypothetical protein